MRKINPAKTYFLIEYVCFDHTWYSYLPAAIIALLVYTVGVPAVFYAKLYRDRAKIEVGSIEFTDRWALMFAVYQK